MKQQHTQDTPPTTCDDFSDAAMDRLIRDLVDDGVSSGLMYMATTPGLRVEDGANVALVLADALRRALAAVPRTVMHGDTVDGVTRFLDAARAAREVQ